MGFFDNIKYALNPDQEILDIYDDMEPSDGEYRQHCFENSSSNNGWYVCARCGGKFRRADMDVDHIVPRSKGGSNRRDNLQLLCKHCNRSKRDDMTDTNSDLRRRRKELDQQDKRDLEWLRKHR